MPNSTHSSILYHPMEEKRTEKHLSSSQYRGVGLKDTETSSGDYRTLASPHTHHHVNKALFITFPFTWHIVSGCQENSQGIPKGKITIWKERASVRIQTQQECWNFILHTRATIKEKKEYNWYVRKERIWNHIKCSIKITKDRKRMEG